MPESKRALKVFLCHASADKPKVRELYRYLRRRGINPWFDEIDLIGGQDWQVEIPKALATSDAIIICLTKSSIDKEGYIQKEIKFALDKALEMPEGRIFLIPVKFEECDVPFSLNRYQWVDLTIEAGFSKMMKALKFRASQLERLTVELPKKAAEEESLALEKTAHEKAEHEAVEKIALENMKREADEKASQEKRRMELERESNRRIERELKSAQREIFFSKIRNNLSLFFIHFRAYIISALLVLIAIAGGLYLRSTFFKNIPAPTQISISELTLTPLPSLAPTDTSVPTEIFTPIPTGTPTVPPSEIFILDGISVAKPSTSMVAENISDIEQLMQWNMGSEFLWISPDSVFVAVASNQEVDVWNTQQGETVATFNIDEIHVDSITFSNDNTLVAVGSSPGYATLDAIVQVWDLNEKKLVRTITIPKSTAALSLSISPDNSMIATGLFTGYTIVWDIQTGKDLLSLGNQFNVSSVIFSPNGDSLASGGGNWIQNDPGEALIIYGIPSGQRMRTLDGKTKAVSSLASTLDGKILASGSLDGKIVLWESETGEIIRTLNIGERVNNLAFTPDGKILASGTGESVQLWQVENGVLLKTIKDIDGKVDNLSFSDDGAILIIGTDSGEISVWGYSSSVSNGQTTNTSVPLPTEITDAKSAQMVLVPSGEFMMGINLDETLALCKYYYWSADICDQKSSIYQDQTPPHLVDLSSYYIDKYEVTNLQYAACVDAGMCSLPEVISSGSRDIYYGNPTYDNYPVSVNWDQSNSFCEWRDARLPTEAEWEKAARGTGERVFPWGDAINCENANFSNCGGSMNTLPVGSYEKGKSPYEVYDMAGNYSEFVSDWYGSDYYQNSPSLNPTGPVTSEYHVIRGGGNGNFGYFLTTVYRGKGLSAGFRCARDTNP